MTAPSILEFRLLGPVAIHHRGKPVDSALTGPARDLLVYLLLHHGTRQPRDQLMDGIWPEARAPSKTAFSTTLWRLKRFVDQTPGVRLDAAGDALRLTLGPRSRIDFADLRAAVAALDPTKPLPLPRDLAARLTRSVRDWRGPFTLCADSDWALVARERFHADYLRALLALMRDAAARKDFEGALDHGLRILVEDPYRESVHCEVMWLLVLTGQRARAIARHRSFVTLLSREMGIGPMAETQALHAYILDGLEQAPDRCPAPEDAPRFRRFLATVEESRASVYAAVQGMVADPH